MLKAEVGTSFHKAAQTMESVCQCVSEFVCVLKALWVNNNCELVGVYGGQVADTSV